MNEPTDIAHVEQLVAKIKPILSGNPPEVQGAVLAELLSLWLAGHPASMRDSQLAMHMQFVRKLVPLSVHELFGARGHPDDRGN